VIRAAAFCPHPPVLVPEIAGSGAVSAAAEFDDLRAACRQSIKGVAAAADRIVLLGTGPMSLAHSPLAHGSLAGYGLPGEIHLGSPACGGTAELPLSLTVGAWLVRDALGVRSGALGFSVGADFGGSRAAVDLLALAETTEVALIVMGDGSARRDLKAPGYLDDRAAGFDSAVAAALASGDPGELATIDSVLGAELLAAGVPAWHAAADVLSGTYEAKVDYDAAPYGVAYFAATWLPQG
jgi:hypothetical protein